MAAIMIPTGTDQYRDQYRRTITISSLPQARRQPTTAPGRRRPVATGGTVGGRSMVVPAPVPARQVARPAAADRPVGRATYWCRRAFVAALVVGLVIVMAQAGAALGGASLATPGRSTASPASAASAGQSSGQSAGQSSVRQTVVRPGDSLWSVASRLAPGTDPRPVVDALVDARGGAPLTPGETVEWGG